MHRYSVSLLRPFLIAVATCFLAAGCVSRRTHLGTGNAALNPVLYTGFVDDAPPYLSSHASTVVETRDGVMSAWFGGTYEKHADVCIWTSRFDGKGWSTPEKVADGMQPDNVNRYPCWNPVLFQPRRGPLLLFYKVGPSPSEWWGMLIVSHDNGHTWSSPRRLPAGQLGPVRNKPVQLADGSLLCPSSSEEDGWRVHLERTADLGLTWESTEALNTKEEFGAIQPTILRWKNGRTQILNRSRQKVVTECWMEGSDWRKWSPMRKTLLPNPNSGIDGLVLQDGRGLLVFNNSDHARTPMCVGLSKDGRDWRVALTLESSSDGELSYPAVVQSRDGLVHITYTWKRQKIRHIVVDPSRLR